MGFLRVLLALSLLIFVYLVNLTSSHRIQKTLPSEFVQKIMLEDNKGIYNGSKIAGGGARGGGGGGGGGGGARGGGGGGARGDGGSGSGGALGGQSRGNGNSKMPKTGGAGAAVIPVYAVGGGANNNRQPHGAANCNLNKVKFSSMLMMTFVYPLMLFFLLI